MAELRYRRPSRDWLDRLPLGNGRLGVMVGADEASIRLGLNEATAWSGSPASALRDLVEPDVAASALAGARAALAADRPLDAEQKMRLIEKLAVRTERAVDLVDLHHAGEPLLGQVLKGRRLLGADSDYTALTLRHLYDQEDFMPYISRMLAERRRAWIG